MNNIPKLTFLINGITIEYYGIFYDKETNKNYLEFTFYSDKDFESDFIVTDTYDDYLIKIHIGRHNGIDRKFLNKTIKKLSKYYHYLIYDYTDFWEVYKYLTILYGTVDFYPWLSLIEIKDDLETPSFEIKLNDTKVKVYSNKHNEKHLKEGFKMFLESEYK